MAEPGIGAGHDARERARQEWRIQQALDRRLDRLVRLGQELVDSRLFGARNHGGLLREAQLRNALAVASATSSIEVVKNWIRYQIGRPDGRGWQHEQFGQGLIEQLERDLNQLAAEVAAELGMPERQPELLIRLARLHLGYLYRHFYYREQERERLRRATPAPGRGAEPRAAPGAARPRAEAGRPAPAAPPAPDAPPEERGMEGEADDAPAALAEAAAPSQPAVRGEAREDA
jgi:hypothetical protein